MLVDKYVLIRKLSALCDSIILLKIDTSQKRKQAFVKTTVGIAQNFCFVPKSNFGDHASAKYKYALHDFK